MGFGWMVSFLWQVSTTLPKEEFERRYAEFNEAGGERRMCSLLRKIDTYKWKDPLLDKLCNALFGGTLLPMSKFLIQIPPYKPAPFPYKF